MTRFTNVELGAFGQYQNTKNILKKKNMGQNRLKKLSKLQKFQLSNFTLTWSNEGKLNSVKPDNLLKRTAAKMKMFDKLILKNI